MVSAAVVFVSVCLVAASAAPSHPHVLFIVADDLGWDDVGFRSHQINTPNIDALAAKGVVLNQYYVQSVCSPSRAAFMTGRYPVHTTIYDWIHPSATYGLPLNETTMAQKFKQSGYETHAVGKWHLGLFKWEYTPTFRGFDTYAGYYTGGEDYFTHVSSGAFDFRRDMSPMCGANCSQVWSSAYGNYSTNEFTTEAVDRIHSHDPSKPFFMYLAYQSVHAPQEVPEAYVAPYNNSISSVRRRRFAGMLSAMDQGIGNVTAALREQGMLDNTLIVFTSDNGGPTTTGDGVGSSNWPLRGGKHTVWEGGVRATSVLAGPMVKATGTYDGLMHGVDWLPTLVTAAGLQPGGTLPLDGVDQWTAINSNSSSPRPSVFLGNNDDNTPESWAIRVGTWKLLWWGGGNPDSWIPPPEYVDNDVLAMTNSSCDTAPGTAYPGNDVDVVAAASPEDCCVACRSVPSTCAGWTYEADEPADACCYLKSKFGAMTSKASATSGSGNAPLPVPAAEWQLYDLATDPTEHHDVAKDNPDIVASLKAQLMEVYNARVPLVPDGSCPPVSHPVDPKVGKVWAPWC